MNPSHTPDSARSPLGLRLPFSRRAVVTGIASGIGLTALTGWSASAATASPSPKLPGEYTRKSNQVTRYNGTLYDNIVVKIKGDPARLYVPQSIKPGQRTPIRVVWLYHGAGSDHNALDGGFKTTGERIVDEGCIAICQNDGGTMYSHPTAQTMQVNGYAWMAGIYTVGKNILRATSGGGALACETYGSKLIPNIAGMYNVNAVYDLTALYLAGGNDTASVIAAFGDDPVAIQAANPARLPASNWANDYLRIVVSQPNSSDTVVPPDQHGLKLLALAQPVAAEASLRTHTNGHSTPGFADVDFIAALQRWAPAYATVDGTPPTVAVTSPAANASIAGSVTFTATASDDTGVTAVSFAAGSITLAATLANGVWSATFDSTLVANGPYTVVATASDAAGNTGVSAGVPVTVANADTSAPSVTLTSPAAGATAAGLLTMTATAFDNVGVTGVSFTVGTVNAGAGTLANGVWSATFDTRTASTPNGSYDVRAIATDAAGNSTKSAPTTIIVKNTDLVAPTVTLTSPASGATATGPLTMTATAADNVGVTGVSFTIGSVNAGAGTLTNGVWSATFDTRSTSTPNGSYDVRAVATDAAGNTTKSAATTITVKNADVTAPVVSITSPANGATVSKTVTATAVATDAVGVTGVKFYASGRLIGPATLANGVWSLSFNTKSTVTPNGVYSITAQATDAAGNVGTSSAISITIKN